MKKLSAPLATPVKPSFRGFDIEDPWLIPQYTRNLPHLRLQEATFFVTFRLADSIPKTVVQRWQEERKQWLINHGINPEIIKNDPQEWIEAYQSIPLSERMVYETRFRREFFMELDKCHGCCILNKTHQIVVNALEFFHGQRLWLGDYVVMPNHVHLLVQPFPGVRLEEWLYSVKRYSSTLIKKDFSSQININTGKRHLWQKESYDRIVRGSDELRRIRKYILNNPAKLRKGTFALKQMNWLDEFTANPTPI